MFYWQQLSPKHCVSTLCACSFLAKLVKHLNTRLICSDSDGYIIPNHIPFVWKESLLNSVSAFLGVVSSSGVFDLIEFDNALASMGPVFKARNQYFATN